MFDGAFVQKMETRYPDALSWAGSELAAVTLSPKRVQFREWIENEIAHLPEPGRGELITRLRNEEHFVTAVNELAVAAVLRDAGLSATYETELHGLTPDLYVPAEADRRPILIEVWTREPPSEAPGQRRAWLDLQRRISKIPIPVALRVEPPAGGGYRAPASGESKQLAAAVRRWLLGTVPTPGDSYNVDGYRFSVADSVLGLRAVLAIPGRTSQLGSEFVVEVIRKKAGKYASVADDLGAHLVVVLASHPLAPLDLGLIRSALDGHLSRTVRFPPDARGPIADWSMRMRRDELAECFEPALSAVGWIVANLGGPELTLLPVGSSARPLPRLASPRVVQP